MHLHMVNEQKQLNDRELYRLLSGIFLPSDSKCWLSSKSSTLEGAEIISLSCKEALFSTSTYSSICSAK